MRRTARAPRGDPRRRMHETSETSSDPARRYARIRRRLLLADLVASLAVLAWMQASGFSRAVARWWSVRLASEPAALLGYLAVVGVAYALAMLPLRFYGGFRLEHRFGLSRLTLRGWCAWEAKQLAVSALLGVALIEGLYALLRNAPGRWPLWATLGWVGVSVVLARIFPTILLPLFYRTVPLQDEPLVERLLALCRRSGLPALGVFRFDLSAESRKANAALAGLGRTRRVLLSDTLLSGFTPEEIEGVLAHELGHQRYRHITKMLLLSGLGSWAAFWLTDVVGGRWVGSLGAQGLSDPAAFPALALWLSILGLISLPIQNAISRRFEWQADRFAVTLTNRPRAFADALRRLGALNLADPAPPRWVVWLFYDHPPLPQRIALADQWGSAPLIRNHDAR